MGELVIACPGLNPVPKILSRFESCPENPVPVSRNQSRFFVTSPSLQTMTGLTYIRAAGTYASAIDKDMISEIFLFGDLAGGQARVVFCPSFAAYIERCAHVYVGT